MKFAVYRNLHWPFAASVFDENSKHVCFIQPHTYSTKDKTPADVDAHPENAAWLEMLKNIGCLTQPSK